MKKLFGAIALVGRITLLLVLVGVAWSISSVQNIFQKSNPEEGKISNSPLGTNDAYADTGHDGY